MAILQLTISLESRLWIQDKIKSLLGLPHIVQFGVWGP